MHGIETDSRTDLNVHANKMYIYNTCIQLICIITGKEHVSVMIVKFNSSFGASSTLPFSFICLIRGGSRIFTRGFPFVTHASFLMQLLARDHVVCSSERNLTQL